VRQARAQEGTEDFDLVHRKNAGVESLGWGGRWGGETNELKEREMSAVQGSETKPPGGYGQAYCLTIEGNHEERDGRWDGKKKEGNSGEGGRTLKYGGKRHGVRSWRCTYKNLNSNNWKKLDWQ